MKNSFYNIPISLDNERILCFNTLRNKSILLTKKDFHALQNSLETIPPKKYCVLKDNGFLIDDDFDELAYIDEIHSKSIDNSVYDLTIMPTLDCNLRCWYCFEKHIKGSHLTTDISCSIEHFAQNILRNDTFSALKITMFGGEPLMYFKEEVFPLLKKIKDFATSIKKKVYFNFITNGVCIVEDTIPMFKELQASFQISIDGYREKHNKVKKSLAIPQPYDVVMRAIHLLSESYDALINLRINYDDETLLHIDEVIKDLLDIKRKNIKVHLERVWQTRKTKGFVDLKKILDLFILNRFNVSYLNFIRKGTPCKSSLNNQSVISYDGSIYKCTGRDFTSQLQEGRLIDGRIVWDENKLNKRMDIITYKNDKCLNCKFLPICWGPCNQKMLENPCNIQYYCQLDNMEISIEDFIKYRVNNELIRQENEKD